MPVDTVRSDYTTALDRWDRCRDCYEGSDAVKAKGVTYLPMLGGHAEKPSKYSAYLQRALFFNATARTVQGLVGAVFQKDPTVTLLERFASHTKDITLTGVTLTTFAQQVLQENLAIGRGGILVDMATAASSEQRPYWVRYRAEQIIAWRTLRVSGDEVLTRVVLKERIEEDDPKDPFAVLDIEQCRVLELRGVGTPAAACVRTLWRREQAEDTRSKWVIHIPEGETGAGHTLIRRAVPLPFIPFVFFGPDGVAPGIDKPPLLDLVDVNLSHYRTSADLEHGRHFTALPTPWVSGSTSKDGEPLAIGSGTAWQLELNGRAGMVEFTGQGLKALETADTEKRHMMAVLGARLLEQQSRGVEAAVTVQMRHAGEHATLRTIAGVSELAVSLALQIHAWWVGSDAQPRDVKAGIEFNKEFVALRLTPEDVKAALLSLQAGGMSFETWFYTLQRGDWARPGATVEEEKALIDADAERLAAREPEPEPEPPEPDPENV
jgi:hypothetical protein